MISNPMMNMNRAPDIGPRLILRGIHLWLTDAMRASIEEKAERLFRHEPRMLRLRIDVDVQLRGRARLFVAKGEVELWGPNLNASVTTDDAYKSVDLLFDKLDRQLRKRATALQSRRHRDDIREHENAAVLAAAE